MNLGMHDLIIVLIEWKHGLISPYTCDMLCRFDLKDLVGASRVLMPISLVNHAICIENLKVK